MIVFFSDYPGQGCLTQTDILDGLLAAVCDLRIILFQTGEESALTGLYPGAVLFQITPAFIDRITESGNGTLQLYGRIKKRVFTPAGNFVTMSIQARQQAPFARRYLTAIRLKLYFTSYQNRTYRIISSVGTIHENHQSEDRTYRNHQLFHVNFSYIADSIIIVQADLPMALTMQNPVNGSCEIDDPWRLRFSKAFNNRVGFPPRYR
jgi:hypothetical protein